MNLEWQYVSSDNVFPWRLYERRPMMIRAAFGLQPGRREVAFWDGGKWDYQKLPESVTTEEEAKAYIEFLVRSGTWRE